MNCFEFVWSCLYRNPSRTIHENDGNVVLNNATVNGSSTNSSDEYYDFRRDALAVAGSARLVPSSEQFPHQLASSARSFVPDANGADPSSPVHHTCENDIYESNSPPSLQNENTSSDVNAQSFLSLAF